jgi:hypothetical protein
VNLYLIFLELEIFKSKNVKPRRVSSVERGKSILRMFTDVRRFRQTTDNGFAQNKIVVKRLKNIGFKERILPNVIFRIVV